MSRLRRSSSARMLRPASLVALSAGFLGLALLSAACGSSPSTSAPSTTTTTLANPLTSAYVTIDGRQYPVPTEDGVAISNFSNSGQAIVLTSSGFLPHHLFAALSTPVVFSNFTDQAVTLTIEHIPGLKPVTIQPGGTYSWVPTVLSFSYESSTGYWGLVDVGAFTH